MFKILTIQDSVFEWGRAFRLMEIEALGVDVPIPVYVDNADIFAEGDFIDAEKVDTMVVYVDSKKVIYPRLINASKSSDEEIVSLQPKFYGAIQKKNTDSDVILHVGVNGRSFYRAGVCAKGWGDVYYRIPVFAYGKEALRLQSLQQGDKALFQTRLYKDIRNGFSYRVESITVS